MNKLRFASSILLCILLYSLMLGQERNTTENPLLDRLYAKYDIEKVTLLSSGIPQYIRGDLSDPRYGNDLVENAIIFLEENKDLFGIKDPRDEYRLLRKRNPSTGGSSVILEQHCHGVSVGGKKFSFRFDHYDSLIAVSGVYLPCDRTISLEPSISEDEVRCIVADSLGLDSSRVRFSDSEPMIIMNNDRTYLTRKMFSTVQPQTFPDTYIVGIQPIHYVDIHTGKILFSIANHLELNK